jgi:uncharacterized protein YfaQ (DUF2300 family)
MQVKRRRSPPGTPVAGPVQQTGAVTSLRAPSPAAAFLLPIFKRLIDWLHVLGMFVAQLNLPAAGRRSGVSRRARLKHRRSITQRRSAVKRKLASILVFLVSGWLTTAAIAEDDTTSAPADTAAAMSESAATDQSTDTASAATATDSTSDGTTAVAPAETDAK